MSELHLPEVPIPMFEDENQQVVIDLSNNAVNEEALVEITRHAEEVVLKGSQKKSKKSSLLDGRKQVVLSNQFVVGTESGTMFAFRIIRIAAAQIPRGAKEFPDVYISADDMEKLGYSRQRLTSHMRDIVNEIMDYRIRVAAYDKDTNECMQLSAVNVFSKCSAHARQGAMTVKLNPDIADYFLNQRRNYTKYNLAIAASVNSYPAAKLHEVLICRTRQYGVNLLRFSIDELRVLLTPMSKAAEKGKKKKSETAEEKRRREHRQSNGVFANNVIKNAVETINQSTECEVYFRTIRSGRNTKMKVEMVNLIETIQSDLERGYDGGADPIDSIDYNDNTGERTGFVTNVSVVDIGDVFGKSLYRVEITMTPTDNSTQIKTTTFLREGCTAYD